MTEGFNARRQQAILSPAEIKELYSKGFADPVFFCQTFLPDLFTDEATGISEIPWVHRGILAYMTRQTDFLLEYGQIDKIVKHFTWSEDPENPKAAEHSLFHPVPRVTEGNGISLPSHTYESCPHGGCAECLERIDMDITKYSTVMMPRGFSKTTICGIAVPVWLILYQERKFILYVSETSTHAETQLKNVRDELEFNPLIHAVFGNLAPDRSSSKKWTGDIIQPTNGVVACARGRGGQVRGLNVGGRRPDMVIVDDVEDEESVKTPDQREKCLKWFFKALKPVLPKMDKTATIIALGTLLHSDALLMKLRVDPEWTAIRFSAIDKDGEALWRQNMSLEELEAEKASYALNGQLNTFYMEYMSQLYDEESAKFKESSFIYRPYTILDTVARAIVVDPAISDKPGADYCAFAVVGMTERGVLPVYDFYGERGMTPREQVDKFFELAIKWDCTHHGVESVAYQAALSHLIKEEMFRKSQIYGNKAYFEVIPILHGAKKHIRVEGVLQPRFAAGYIHFTRRFPMLETQLKEWPDGKKDAPDAVAMAITLLDPYAAQAGAGDGDEAHDLGSDEYEPLDELLEGGWEAHL